jgi:hypothetical protein
MAPRRVRAALLALAVALLAAQCHEALAQARRGARPAGGASAAAAWGTRARARKPPLRVSGGCAPRAFVLQRPACALWPGRISRALAR